MKPFVQRSTQAGFTYLMLLWWVALSGVMLMALPQSWSQAMRRQREAELVFRGEQMRQAIESYRKVVLANGGAQWPTNLQDLLEDHRGPKVVRHLRRLWPDPITGRSQWGLVKDGVDIKGVFSDSTAVPLAAPEGVTQYKDWRFVAPGG